MACCRDSLVKLTFTSGPRKASNESSAPSGATRPGTRAFALDMSQLASEDRVPPLQALTAGKNVGPTKLAGIVKRRPAQRGSWLVLDCQAKAEPELGGARTVRAESRDTGDCFRRWAFLDQQPPATPCQRCRFALPVLPLRLADIAWPRPKRAAPKHACRFRTRPASDCPAAETRFSPAESQAASDCKNAPRISWARTGVHIGRTRPYRSYGSRSSPKPRHAQNILLRVPYVKAALGMSRGAKQTALRKTGIGHSPHRPSLPGLSWTCRAALGSNRERGC